MPKLRQPTSLAKMAMDVLFEHVVDCCDRLSVAGSFAELIRSIAVIKKEICSCIPRFLLADFCRKFIERFHSRNRSDSHCSAALEIMMDLEIVGLEFTGPITQYLDFTYAERLKKLEKLELQYAVGYSSKYLEKLHLDDLKTFIFEDRCSDLDLKIVGQKCAKLQVLKVQRSGRVTDAGLAALRSCTELRVINFSNCSISHDAYKNFFTVHKNIEEITCGDDLVANFDTSVYPAMNRFILESDNAGPEEILKIVKKFPNLTYFVIRSAIPDDLSPLKFLNKLQVLAIDYGEWMDYVTIGESWLSAEEVLRFVGANITSLELSVINNGILWDQDNLNFILQYCPNIEYLKYVHSNGLAVVPAFPKLKKLVPVIDIEFESLEILETPEIEFETLLELEYLSLENFDVSFRVIESIMLDHVKFPKLSVVKTRCMKPEDILEIERIARLNNLDFKIDNNPESNWWIEHRLGIPSPE